MQTFPLELSGGHLVFLTGSQRVLLDTGAPRSFGEVGQWGFMDRTYDLRGDFLGLDAQGLTERLGTEVDVLLGMDILADLHFLTEARRGSISFSRDRFLAAGAAVQLTSFCGIPIVPLGVAGSMRGFFVDTGSRMSYLERRIAERYPEEGEGVHEVPVVLGGISFRLRFGVLPPEQEAILKGVGPSGILNADMLTLFDVCFALPDGKLFVCGQRVP